MILRPSYFTLGITNLGYFSPIVDELTEGGRLVYFIGAPSRAERDASLAAFAADAEWSGPSGARALSEFDGKLIDRVESVFLEPTSYSPPVSALARDGQLLELRRYAAAEGKNAALNDRFREGGPTWIKNGLAAVAYLQPTPSEEVAPDGEVWLLLAHPSLAAAPAAYDRLHADPADIAFKQREAVEHGAPPMSGVATEFLTPTDYSPSLPPTGCALRHFVCFKFKEGTTDATAQALVDDFANLAAEIGTIRSFEWARNSSREGKDHGLTRRGLCCHLAL
jgi:hypothetical protein